MGTWSIGSTFDGYRHIGGRASNYDETPFIVYTNTSNSVEQITSITIPLGTGMGEFSGVNYTGAGETLNFYLYANNSSTYTSSTAKVSKQVSAGSEGYAAYTDMQTYTVSFATPPKVAAGNSISFYLASYSTYQATDILCFNRTAISGVTSAATFTVKFDLDGGTHTGGGDLTQTVEYGGSATAPTCIRTGYDFSRWDGTFTNVTSDRTITAIWNIKTYTISYNANGGSGAPSSQTKTYGQALTLSSTKPTKSTVTNSEYTVEFNSNSSVTNPSSKTATKTTSYTFSSWNTAKDGSGTSYASGGSYTAGGGISIDGDVISSYLNTTQLWTNPNPTNSYGANTEDMDLSGYRFVLVGFRTSTTYYYAWCEVGRSTYVFQAAYRNYRRSISVTTSGITFGNCQYYATYGSNTASSDNTFLIPNKIWGVK